MISIEQQENYLIGSLAEIKALSQKEKARVLIISDSHGNPYILHKIINQFGADCDALVFCGDGIGDLMSNLEEAAIDAEFNRNFPPVLAFVSGNCDSFYGETKIPFSQTLKIGNHCLYICHGNRDGVNYGFELLVNRCKNLNCDVGLFGHTHVAYESYIDDVYIANPGSCSRPRNGQNPGFAILTLQKKVVDFAFIQILNCYGSEPEFKLYSPVF